MSYRENLFTDAWEEVLTAPREILVTGPREILLTVEGKNSLPHRRQNTLPLTGKLADAEKLGQQAESLKSENEKLKNAAASERIDFALQLAGCRSVKAARAVLDDYDGNVEKLKAAEPWLFATQSAQAGATGLPNAGTASDDGKDERHWRKIVGLPAKKSNE